MLQIPERTTMTKYKFKQSKENIVTFIILKKFKLIEIKHVIKFELQNFI
jgi:hypothetical protein